MADTKKKLAAPPRSLVDDVREAVAFMSGFEVSEISTSNNDRLEIDLRLTKYQLKALAIPFLRIAEKHRTESLKSDPKITRNECEKLKKVLNAINLVSKAAGYKEMEASE